MGNLLVCYKFDKRINSTKLPEGTGEVTISGNVALKKDTSLEKPVFVMAIGADDMELLWKTNYAKFLDVYYWVEDKVYTSNSHVEIHCTVDPLATLRDKILNTNAFVMYDETSNTEIPDNRISRRTTKTIAHSSTGGIFPIETTNGSIVATIVGEESVDNFVFTPNTLQFIVRNYKQWWDDAMNSVPEPTYEESSSSEIWEQIKNFGKNFSNYISWVMNRGTLITKNMFNVGSALDNIKSATWYPFSVGALMGTGAKKLTLGSYDTGLVNDTLMKYSIRETKSLSIPWQASDWRRRSPYHEIYISMEYLGIVQLSPDDLIDEESLTLVVVFNALSGAYKVDICGSGATRIIATASCNLGGPFPVGSSNIDVAKATSTIVSVAGTAVSGAMGYSALASVGSPYADATAAIAMAGVANGAVRIVNDLQPTGTYITSGGGGLLSGFAGFTCTTIYHNTNVEPSSISSVCGTPTLANKRIGDLKGYVQTSGVSVNANSECIDIVSKANALIDGGVFIE